MSTTARTLVTDSLIEIGVIAASETPSDADAAWVLSKLNRIANRWNAQREAIYAETFLSETITPNLNPSTIGPTGATFTVTQRPVVIHGANLILNNVSPAINVPLVLRDRDWWLAQSIPTLTIPYPTDLYYEPTYPNGSIYLWPVPTVAYGLQLLVWSTLTDSYVLATTFAMPPGYQDALTLTLAEEIAPSFGKVIAPQTAQSARAARAVIFKVNDPTPRIRTADAGLSGQGQRSNWNYYTGLTTSGGQ